MVPSYRRSFAVFPETRKDVFTTLKLNNGEVIEMLRIKLAGLTIASLIV